jgi:hypothetical protein
MPGISLVDNCVDQRMQNTTAPSGNHGSKTKNFPGSNDKTHTIQDEPEGILENYGDKMGYLERCFN